MMVIIGIDCVARFTILAAYTHQSLPCGMLCLSVISRWSWNLSYRHSNLSLLTVTQTMFAALQIFVTEYIKCAAYRIKYTARYKYTQVLSILTASRPYQTVYQVCHSI